VTGSYDPVNYLLEDIVLVSSIAPTDFGVRARPGGVDYHMIYGSSDGDVQGRPGSGSKPFAIYERAMGVKQLTYIHGADHNDFNCCGFNDFRGPPGTEIGRPEAQQVAKADWLALLQRTVRGNEPALDVMRRQWESLALPGVRATTVVDKEYQPGPDAGSMVIDDFQSQPSPAVASSGASVLATVSGTFEGLLRDTDGVLTSTSGDPMNGMTRVRPGSADDPRGVVFGWTGPAFFEYTLTPALRDASGMDLLSFRAAQITRHPSTIAELADLSFTVTLVDRAGVSASIDFGVYGGGAEEPYQRTGEGTGAGWASEFETIEIPLADFLRDGGGPDLSDLDRVRLEFGPGFGADEGRIAIDDVAFRLR